jgi:plasmid stability protein
VAAITIRNLDETLKARLRLRAARRGKSMEEEARDILRAALSSEPKRTSDLGQTIRKRFAALGGVDLPELARAPIRDPVDFEE